MGKTKRTVDWGSRQGEVDLARAKALREEFPNARIIVSSPHGRLMNPAPMPQMPQQSAGISLGTFISPELAAAIDPATAWARSKLDPVALGTGATLPQLQAQEKALGEMYARGERRSFPVGPGGMQQQQQQSSGPISLGSWQKVTERGPRPLENLEEDIEGYAARKKAGQEEMTLAETEQARQERGAVSGAQKRLQEVEARKAQKVTKLQAKRDQEMMLYQQAREQAAQEEVDPDAWWSSRTTPQKVMALVGIALGAFGEGFTGGRVRNAALQIVEKEIDRDIQSQLANQRKKASERQESIGIIRTLGGMIEDEQALAQNAKVMLMQNLALQMKEKALAVKDRRLQAQLMMTSAAIDQEAKLRANAIYMQRQPKIRTISGGRQVIAKTGGKMGGGAGDGDYLSAARSLSALTKRVAAGGRWSGSVALGRLWPGQTQEKATENDRQMYGVQLAKAAGAGQLSNEERMVAANTAPGHNQTLQAQLDNVKNSYGKILNLLDADLRRARSAGNAKKVQYLESQIAPIKRQMTGDINIVVRMSGF